MNKKPGIYLFCLALLMLFLAACQSRGASSEPVIPPTALPTLPAAKSATAHTVTLLTATPVETGSVTITLESAATPTQIQTTIPASGIDDTELPLIRPYLSEVIMSAHNTLVRVGFEFNPGLVGKPGFTAEIYDARLFDQDGREYPLQSTGRLQPDLAEAEFSALNPSVEELSLQLEYSLRGLPADHPLVIDLAGHSVGESWPIQSQVKFGDLLVQLQSASLSIYESGAPPNVMKSIQLELRGKNARWHDAQLICLSLFPAAPADEYETVCGQEPGGILTAVTLGEPVGRSAPLPLLPGTLQFQVTGDFLILDPWETSWTIAP